MATDMLLCVCVYAVIVTVLGHACILSLPPPTSTIACNCRIGLYSAILAWFVWAGIFNPTCRSCDRLLRSAVHTRAAAAPHRTAAGSGRTRTACAGRACARTFRWLTCLATTSACCGRARATWATWWRRCRRPSGTLAGRRRSAGGQEREQGRRKARQAEQAREEAGRAASSSWRQRRCGQQWGCCCGVMMHTKCKACSTRNVTWHKCTVTQIAGYQLTSPASHPKNTSH